jgi:quinol monooxygenase YgiN
MSVTVIIELPAHREKVDELKSFIRSIVADTRTFEGFEKITMHQHQDDPSLLILLETWETRGHHEKYLAWRTDRGDLATIVGLLCDAPAIRYFDAVEV